LGIYLNFQWQKSLKKSISLPHSESKSLPNKFHYSYSSRSFQQKPKAHSNEDFVMAITQKINLAKFGYIIDVKVVGEKKNRVFLYSWLPTRTYHKKLAFWVFFFL
jgi:hypothetical protein